MLAPSPRIKHVLAHAELHYITAPVSEQEEWLEQRAHRDGRLGWRARQTGSSYFVTPRSRAYYHRPPQRKPLPPPQATPA